MSKVKDNSNGLEILVATMNKTSLDFLSTMFSSLNYLDYSILIINQTTKTKLLKSKHPSIRVINSFERGLSKSRNLAIKNAIAPICLIADDDVVFEKGFEEIILNSHKKYKQPIITFQTKTTQENLYWNYPTQVKTHNNYIRRKTLSVEISFKKNELKKINFDERFGLGANFEDSENYIFLTEAKNRGLECLFVNKSISSHKPTSSSDQVESNRLLYAKAALNTYEYGNFAHFFVFKFVFFLLRKKYISLQEVKGKLRLGFKAISDFKES